MFTNPFKKKVTEVKIDYPSTVILIGYTPLFGENVELGYNEESGQYESYLKMPMIDENGKELDSGFALLSIHPNFMEMPISNKLKALMTKKEFELANFETTKVDLLKELLSKIERL